MWEAMMLAFASSSVRTVFERLCGTLWRSSGKRNEEDLVRNGGYRL